MAIDPKMLAAFASEDAESDDMDESEMEDMEPEAAPVEEGVDEEALAEFLSLLMELGPQIESAAQAAELLDIAEELPEEVSDAIMTALEDMPPELKMGLAEYVAKMDADDLHAIVEQMEDSGSISNDGIVVPWLYWASRLVAGEGAMEEPGELVEEEEEMA